MGTLLLDALQNGDTAVLLPWMLVVGVVVILANVFADVLYAALDPRVRLA
jgi:peptide/nickel transport system permease protein